MKKKIWLFGAFIAFSLLLVSCAGKDNISVSVTRVGTANLVEENVKVQYPYAFEINFFDGDKAIQSLEEPKTVYISHDPYSNDNTDAYTLYKVNGDALEKIGGRYIKDSFTMEAPVKESGIYVIQLDEDSLNVDDKGSGISPDSIVVLKRYGVLEETELEGKDSFNEVPKKYFVEKVQKLIAAFGGKALNLSEYETEDSLTYGDINSILIEAYPEINEGSKISEYLSPERYEFEGVATLEDALYSLKDILFLEYEKEIKYPVKDADKIVAFEGIKNGNLYSYPAYSDAIKSEDYTLTANGTQVYVEKLFGDTKKGADTNIARLSADGEVKFEITASDIIKGVTVSPLSKNYEVRYSGNKAYFTAAQNGQIVVQFGNLDRLIIFLDKPETDAPAIDGDKVFNVLDFGADKTGETSSTKALNDAVEKAAETGGTVYVPNGVYLTGPVNLKSNVSLYLEPAAKLAGEGDKPEDYSGGKAGNALVKVEDAENVKIYGRGAIDAKGCRRRMKNDKFRTRTLASFNAKNLTVNDVTLQDPGSWNTHIIYSDTVSFDNVKVVNNIRVINTDGIDPDWSRNVIITNSFFICGDDPIVFKSTKNRPVNPETDFVYNIVAKGNVAFTTRSALKVGTETNAAKVYDIIFEDNDVVCAGRAFALYLYDNAEVYNISWINNRVERLYDWYTSGKISPFDFEVADRDGQEPMPTAKAYNILLKDNKFLYDGRGEGKFVGKTADSMLSDVTFDNFVVGGKKIMSLDEMIVKTNEFISNIIFK